MQVSWSGGEKGDELQDWDCTIGGDIKCQNQ